MKLTKKTDKPKSNSNDCDVVRFVMTNDELQTAIEKTREMERNCCNGLTKEKLSDHLYDLLEVQKSRAAFSSLSHAEKPDFIIQDSDLDPLFNGSSPV